MKKIMISSIICIVIDQLIKLFVISSFNVGKGINIINDFFSITYVKNTGAAFSILSGNRIFLIIITILALIGIYYFLIKEEKKNLILYGILYGGIIGNFIDRLFRGYVIDFLDFKIFGYDFPIFNFADICIVVSIFLIVIISIKEAMHGKNKNK